MVAATRAVEADRAYGIAHVSKGVLLALSMGESRMDEALDSVRRGLELNPHETHALIGFAFVENMAGNSESAIKHLQHSLRASPRDPMLPHLNQQLAMSCFGARRYSEGVAYALRGIGDAPGLPALHAYPEMKKAGGGKIINIGSMASYVGGPRWTAYGPAKAGIVRLSKNCASA